MTKDQMQNITLILYSVPFLAGIVGWIYYYAVLGVSERSFYTIFIVVSKDPFIFLFGSVGAIFATVFDAKNSKEGLEKIVLKLEKIALAILIIEAIGALIIAGLDIAKLFYMFVDGKYAVMLPLSLLIYSYLIPLGETKLSRPSITSLATAISIVIMISSPALLFYMYASRGLVTLYPEAMMIFLVGFLIFIISNRAFLGKKLDRKTK